MPSLARTIQHRVEALAAEDYILAYRSHGFSTFHIISYHIIWMLCRPLIVRQCAYVFGYVLFVETALSYLEFGVLPALKMLCRGARLSRTPRIRLAPGRQLKVSSFSVSSG